METPIMNNSTEPTASTSQTNFTFPQKIKLFVILDLTVTNQDERDYYLDAETGELGIGFIADLNDTFCPVGQETLDLIDAKNNTDIQRLLGEIEP